MDQSVPLSGGLHVPEAERKLTGFAAPLVAGTRSATKLRAAAQAATAWLPPKRFSRLRPIQAVQYVEVLKPIAQGKPTPTRVLL